MDVHARLREIAPRLAQRTLFVTGGAFTPRARAFLDEVGRRHLQKPFDAEELRTRVREVAG